MAAAKPAAQAPEQDVQEGQGVDVAALQAQLVEMQAELAAARAAPAPANDRLADVLEMVASQLGGRGVEQVAFQPGETPDQVLASLEGRVSRGEHSGRKLDHPAVFISRGKNLRIIKKSRIRYTDARGELVVTEGVHYPFEPDGRFETDDAEVVEYLQSRPAFGVEFWEMGNDPAAAPDPQPIIDTIIEAGLELDDERLAVIEAEEVAGLKRELVLKTVRATRRKVQGMGLEPAADPEVVA